LPQIEANAFVDDAEISGEERQGFAEGLRGGCDVEEKPDFARIAPFREMEGERGVAYRLGCSLQEFALRRSRDAPLRHAEVRPGEPDPFEQRADRDAFLTQGRHRAADGEARDCRQRRSNRRLPHRPLSWQGLIRDGSTRDKGKRPRLLTRTTRLAAPPRSA